jgi:hypothetical protein
MAIMADTLPKRPWFTPSVLLVCCLLAVESLLYVSESMQWFWFNERKGYTVLVTCGVALVSMFAVFAGLLLSCFAKSKSQFTLATLLFAVVAIAFPSAWLARDMQRAREQQELLRMDYTQAFHKDKTYLSDGADEWLTKLFGQDFFRDVARLSLTDVEVTDAEMVTLGAATDLRYLDLKPTKVSADGWRQLRQLSQLECLALRGPQVADQELKQIEGLAGLEILVLDRTQVTDTGLKSLKGLKRLKVLDIQETPVSDLGLEHLKELSQLQSVTLFGTQASGAGVQALRRALPDCQVLSTAR